jgi:hypothetical protein
MLGVPLQKSESIQINSIAATQFYKVTESFFNGRKQIPKKHIIDSTPSLPLILIPKLHILAISKIRKLDIPRVLNNSSIPLLVLPAVVKQQRNRSRNRHRIHHDDRQLGREIQRRVAVAESQWAEDVALLPKSAIILNLHYTIAKIVCEVFLFSFISLTKQKLINKIAFIVTFFVCPP